MGLLLQRLSLIRRGLEVPEYTTVNQIPAPNSTVSPPFSHARILARQSTGINRIEFVTWRAGEPATRVWLTKTGTQTVNGVEWEVWEGDVPSPQTFETNYTGYFDIYGNDGSRKEYSFPYTIAVTPPTEFPWWILGLIAAGFVLAVVVSGKAG